MAKDAEDFLFVYGSLQKRANNRAHKSLKDHAEFVCRALFNGELFLVLDYPGAIASNDPEATVEGELYRLLEPNTIFKKLDQYEGYDPESPADSLYIRKQTSVRSATEPDNTFKSWIYLYNKPTTHLAKISSGDYLSFLQEKEAD